MQGKRRGGRPSAALVTGMLGSAASGIAALGLIGPVLFLLASTNDKAVSRVLVSGLLLFIAVLGLRAIYAQLFRDAEPHATGLIRSLCWSQQPSTRCRVKPVA